MAAAPIGQIATTVCSDRLRECQDRVMTSPRAGQPAAPEDLIDVSALIAAYYDLHPDPAIPEQRVSFGTSGHRGSSLTTTFNEDHIIATSQAICEYRAGARHQWPAVPRRRHPRTDRTGDDVRPRGVRREQCHRSHRLPRRIHTHPGPVARDPRTQRRSVGGLADGVVVTPSHNPPSDGGFKYNPPDGGPAGTDITGSVPEPCQRVARRRMPGGATGSIGQARGAETTRSYDYLDEYVGALSSVLDLDAIRSSGLRIGADPLGGASVAYWGEIGSRYGLDLTVVNPDVDPTFRFMTLDWDGKIRMDCSSRYAMASLIARQHDFDIATGNDTDADRHGIVTPDGGLMNPNHYLAVAIQYLYERRTSWPAHTSVGKTLVSSSMIDKVAEGLARPLLEVPVGFKWFVPGLRDGSVAFGGEESAGASFLQQDGSVWTTDKDGIIMCLLASEITAVNRSDALGALPRTDG